MTIPDEAIEAAARALPANQDAWPTLMSHLKQVYRDKARRALEAAEPFIVKAAKAEGWDEGYAACARFLSDYDDWDANYDDNLVYDDILEGHRDDNPPVPKRPENPYQIEASDDAD